MKALRFAITVIRFNNVLSDLKKMNFEIDQETSDFIMQMLVVSKLSNEEIVQEVIDMRTFMHKDWFVTVVPPQK